jgi:hypothetical protein
MSKHRGGAPKGAINLSALDGAPLPAFGGKEKRTEGGPAHSFTGVRSVGSAGYLTIESEQDAGAAARTAHVIYENEGHLW